MNLRSNNAVNLFKNVGPVPILYLHPGYDIRETHPTDETMTAIQHNAITTLERKGFRVVHQWTDRFTDETTVVLARRKGKLTRQAQIDHQGEVNGLSLDTYLHEAKKRDDAL